MPNSIEIRRAALLEALRPFKRLSAKAHKEDALLFMDGADLIISAVGLSSGVTVTGQWTSEVRVPVNFIITNAKALPSADPVLVRVADGRLYFASFSISCHVQKPGENEILLAADADFVTILDLGFEYSSEQIERAGLTKIYREAQKKLQKLVTCAAEPLLRLGITETEVVEFVKIKLQSKRNKSSD